jgi:hypothetical protein
MITKSCEQNRRQYFRRDSTQREHLLETVLHPVILILETGVTPRNGDFIMQVSSKYPLFSRRRSGTAIQTVATPKEPPRKKTHGKHGVF